MSDSDTTQQDGPVDPRKDLPAYGEDDEQDYVDRSVIDFDPNDGLYAGTAVDGSTKIPGDHPDLDERGVDYEADDLDGAGDSSNGDNSDGDNSAGDRSAGDGPKPGPDTAD